MKKIHWKKLHNPDHLGAYSLQSEGLEELTVTIESVSKELVPDPNGKMQECIVAKLKGQKPLVLNATNCKTITNLYDSPFTDDWVGKKITLEVKRIKAFGEEMDALRVKKTLPALPELTPQHEKWEGAKKALKEGTVSIEQIKKSYKITKGNEKELLGKV